MGAAAEAAGAEALFDGFLAAMQALEPFEPDPAIAIGVSGGPDSMALARLLHCWSRSSGARLTALTVDHSLRAGSAREAAQVGEWMRALGIPHEILKWTPPETAGAASQQAARIARYELLDAWCRENAVLHLALAHHADDQAETVLLRFARGSGPQGLAGMPAIRELGAMRLIRPLLALRKAALTAYCRSEGQKYVEDPSNASARFARPRLRAAATALAAEGLTTDSLLATAQQMAVARQSLDHSVAGLLAASVTLSPQAYAWLRLDAFNAAPAFECEAALGCLLATLGGKPFPPRRTKLGAAVERLAMPAPRGFTLAGCRLDPSANGRLLVTREASRCAALPLAVPGRLLWDGRFAVTVSSGLPETEIRAVGQRGWLQLKDAGRVPHALPRRAVLGLPGLWRDGVLIGLPSLAAVQGCAATFAPLRPLTQANFAASGGIARRQERFMSSKMTGNPESSGLRSAKRVKLSDGVTNSVPGRFPGTDSGH